MPDYPILEIKNLSVSFKTDNSILTAVNNISFSLEKGKTLGIVGNLVLENRLLLYQLCNLLIVLREK